MDRAKDRKRMKLFQRRPPMAKQPDAGTVASMQANLKALSDVAVNIPPPPRRPLLEQLMGERAKKQGEVLNVIAALKKLESQLNELRSQEAWLEDHPDFDAIHERLLAISLNGSEKKP
jgi:hypothetical protein